MESATPMMRQYLEIKSKHPGMLVFFRLGDFYEMFFDDAVEAARVLEITLTSRNNDRSGKPIPMCGVPHHAVNSYLAKLVRRGYRVAICEQVEDPSQAKGIVRREVTRIVTPGTAIEDSLLETSENNFLGAIVPFRERIGVSFLDVSTGEFWLSEVSGEDPWGEVSQQLAQFGPSEIVLPEADRALVLSKLSNLEGDRLVTPQADWTFQEDYSRRLLLDHFQVATLDGFGINGQVSAISAAGGLLYYVRQTQKTKLSHITRMNCLQPGGTLKLDDSTVNNLELLRSNDGSKKWTLLAVLDSTRTGMGGRLLRSWMLRPSLEIRVIEERLDAVEELLESAVNMGRLGETLKSIYDLERLLSRATLGNANARDLLALKESFAALPKLAGLLSPYRCQLLRREIDLLEDLHGLLEESIHPEAPVSLSEGDLIRQGYCAELDELRDISRNGKSFIARLEESERRETGIQNLKVKYNRVFGYFLEVTKSNLDQVPDRYIRKQTLVNAERFITPELKEYEDRVLVAEERIIELEKELFTEVRGRVAAESLRIQGVARRVGVLDVLLAFAENARRYRYVRPVLDDSCDLEIKEGRHPVLELHGSEPFVPNDLFCNNTSDQLHILTGPNMGGKSTYLRQNALIVILAQMGSFVPAGSARIGLVDRIYTRVGASDNLARGRSTFMVEMIETANILNTATPRSLILLDEVGRGTATFDGLSLAWSIAEYLLNETARKARTLFATHYQELTKLDRLYEGVKNFCVSVRESNGQIIFFHRVMPGIANRSYGIEVARLAGIPGPVLARARELLSRLERKELNLSGERRASTSEDVLADLQGALF